MNFFEQELRKLADQCGALADPRYIGRACYGRVSGGIRAKLQFVTMGTHERYEALKVTLINNTDGVIDSNTIRFKDIWGTQKGTNYAGDISPQMWTYNGKTEWYGFVPGPADYELLAGSVDEHLEMFREDIEQHNGQTMA